MVCLVGDPLWIFSENLSTQLLATFAVQPYFRPCLQSPKLDLRLQVVPLSDAFDVLVPTTKQVVLAPLGRGSGLLNQGMH